MVVHDLKTEPKHYEDVRSGLKQFEVRFNDRNFQVGDWLLLNRFDPNECPKETFMPLKKRIGYILSDEKYLQKGYVVLGFEVWTK